MDYKLFKLLVDNMPHPMWIKDTNLKFIYMNDKYKSMLNAKDKILDIQKNKDGFDGHAAEDYEQQCKLVIKTLRPIEEIHFINGFKTKINIKPLIDEEGRLQGIAGVYPDVKDINEKDKIIDEQQNIINVVMETLPGMVFYKDKAGKYVYVNEEFNKFHNKHGLDTAVGMTNFELHSSKKLAVKFSEEDRQVMETAQRMVSETAITSDDGSVRYTEAIKTPVLNKENETVGVVGLIFDVTEKKKEEENLRRLSYTDILTGLFNRAYFEEKVKELSSGKQLSIGVIMGDADGLKLVNDTLGHLQGDILLQTIAKVLKDVCNDGQLIFRTGGDEFVILIPNSTDYECEHIIKKIFNQCGKYKHDLIDISISLGYSITDHSNRNIYESLKEAEAKVYRQKLLQKNSFNNSIISSLQTELEMKSLETKKHTENVLDNAIAIGEKLGLPISVMDELTIVAKLHDIGKIAINESILLKSGHLTDDEFEIVKTHTEKGYRIIKASNQLDNVAKGVLAHHERWDGSGYPLNLKGESIPLISRIVSIADAYDSMINNDIYRRSLSQKEAIQELINCSGKQFDPDIVDVFVEYLVESDEQLTVNC